MDAAQIKAIIEGGRFAYYGIRGLCPDEQYAVGDTPRYSYDWDHENDISTFHTTGIDVGGVCTIGIPTLAYSDEEIMEHIESAIKAASMYSYGRLALIGGDSMEYGEDQGEEILSCAEVLAVWEV